MVEIALYIGLGFFLASIVALTLLPFIWGRAVRLTRKAIETSNPISYARATMAKDALRAEHAIAVRQMEVRLQQMTEKLAENAAARSTAEARLAELQEELNIAQLKSTGQRRKVAASSGFFGRAKKPEPVTVSAEDRISAAPETPPKRQSAKIVQLHQEADQNKARELDQEPQETDLITKPAPASKAEDAEMDLSNPLAELATQISKQVSEMTAEAGTKTMPASPAEAAELASQSFTKLKSRYSSLEKERDQLKRELQREKAALAKTLKRTTANPTIQASEHMKRLEDNLEDAKQTIEIMTKQLEEKAARTKTFAEAETLREELKDLASQITARAIAENKPLSDKYDAVLDELSTLTAADTKASETKPEEQKPAGKAAPAKKRRAPRKPAATRKPAQNKTSAAAKTATTAKAKPAETAKPTSAAEDQPKDLAGRIADARKSGR